MEFLPYPHLIATLFNGCAFGPPFPFTETSTWTWIGHPVSGLPVLTLRPIQTCSRFGSMTESLNLASTGNSPDRSTKSTRSHLNVLPQFVNTGFQVLFHSPPGVLFTFPSQYYALSVTKEYLALEGGPSDFPQGFSCLVVLWIPLAAYHFPVRGFHSLRPDFPDSSGNDSAHLLRSLTPACTHAGLGSSHFARRYFGNRCFFLFLWLLRCFSSPGSFHTLWIGVWILEAFSSRFPHSDISGSMDICSSPKLFAAYHVFHRLLVPRHPPCALISLTIPTPRGYGFILRMHSVASHGLVLFFVLVFRIFRYGLGCLDIFLLKEVYQLFQYAVFKVHFD